MALTDVCRIFPYLLVPSDFPVSFENLLVRDRFPSLIEEHTPELDRFAVLLLVTGRHPNVFRLLTSFLLPFPEQSEAILIEHDPGISSTNERLAVRIRREPSYTKILVPPRCLLNLPVTIFNGKPPILEASCPFALRTPRREDAIDSSPPLANELPDSRRGLSCLLLAITHEFPDVAWGATSRWGLCESNHGNTIVTENKKRTNPFGYEMA